MSISLTDLVAKFDALYGAAYTSLTSALGNTINDYRCVKQDTTIIKSTVRGGSDLIGVVDNTTTDFAVGALASPTYSVYVNPGDLYFNNVKKTILATTTVNLGDADVLGNSVASYVAPLPNTGYAAYITIQDSASPSVTVTKGTNYSYGTGNITNCPLPAFPRNEIPVAKVYIGAGGATGISDIRQVYAAAPSDALVLAMFSGVDSVENTSLVKTFNSDFSAGLTSLNSYCQSQTGQTLKAYFANNTWTDGFRQLYADQYTVDLKTNLYAVSPTGMVPTVYGNVLKTPNTIQVVTDSVNVTWSATTTVQVYAVKNAYGYLSLPQASSAICNLSIANLTASSAFPVANGYGAVDNYDGTFNWFQYGSSNQTEIATVVGISGDHKAWDKVYNVELTNIYIPSGALQNVAYAVGTSGSKYLGIAVATIPIFGTYSARVKITNT